MAARFSASLVVWLMIMWPPIGNSTSIAAAGPPPTLLRIGTDSQDPYLGTENNSLQFRGIAPFSQRKEAGSLFRMASIKRGVTSSPKGR